eukprot:6204888-Pleurochrysis_carterae.AAC.7
MAKGASQPNIEMVLTVYLLLRECDCLGSLARVLERYAQCITHSASSGIRVDSSCRSISVACACGRHNLEYPRFYRRLYGLVTAEALRGPHRALFATELQLFLSSVALPAYLTAAFVKASPTH